MRPALSSGSCAAMVEAPIQPARTLTLLLTLALGTTSCVSFRDCGTEDASAAESLPLSLSETGLYDDISELQLSVEAIEFSPRFPLWTDGADKRRWLVLPEDAQVDTTDPDDWVFPAGTRFFKEFSVDGVRLETRMNLLTDEGWTAVTYLWSADGSDAERSLESVADIAGTDHDVPSAAECLACHAGRRNFALGFSATQLDVDVRAELYEAGLLTEPVLTELDLDPVAMEGLGVLHGNCSHCHNSTREQQVQATECYAPFEDDNFDLTLPADLDAVEDAPALLTARFQLLGDREGSEIVRRMSMRNQSESDPSMPPLGTELVDEDGLLAVEQLVDELVALGL